MKIEGRYKTTRHTWVQRHTMAPALQVDEELLSVLEGVHGPAVVHGRGPVIALGQGVALQGHQLQQLLSWLSWTSWTSCQHSWETNQHYTEQHLL